MSKTKNILLTGASSGIGKRTAMYLVEQGYQVYGTSRNPKANIIDGIRMIPLDVTDDASVRACVETVCHEAGRIDVLINNAGVELSGALEETTLDEAKVLFETNFFGVMRVTQAVLPHMRQNRSGQIINVGSVGGTIGFPFQPIYSASKHALKGLTDGLRFEVEPFGIQVYVVQPNIFRSEIAVRMNRAEHPVSAYDGARDRMIRTFEHRINHGPDSIAVARRIEKIIAGRTRGWLQPVGFQAIFSELRLFYPPPYWDNIMRWTWYITDENTWFARGMRLFYRCIGRKDGEIPPDLPPLDNSPTSDKQDISS